ncbi:MAG: DNA-deoxyinosine glycosylase [Lachnospiraceae bacterium]
MSEYTHIIHPFEPCYDQNSKILILGSLPSVKSREEGFYYGHPRNRFWKMLSMVWNEPEPVTIEEKKKFVIAHHLALYDAIYSCDIIGSADSTIRNVVPADISMIMQNSSVGKILLNGRTAEKYFKKYQPEKYQCYLRSMPSTSPANAAVSLNELVQCWKIHLE